MSRLYLTSVAEQAGLCLNYEAQLYSGFLSIDFSYTKEMFVIILFRIYRINTEPVRNCTIAVWASYVEIFIWDKLLTTHKEYLSQTEFSIYSTVRSLSSKLIG